MTDRRTPAPDALMGSRLHVGASIAVECQLSALLDMWPVFRNWKTSQAKAALWHLDVVFGSALGATRFGRAA